VRFFAAHRERIGTDRLEVDLPEGASVGDLVERVVGEFPVLAAVLGAARFAVNREYVPFSTGLHDGDEVAIIPPVAGGEGEMQAGVPTEVERRFQVVDRPIVADEVIRRVEHPGNGAICVFYGVVRDHALSGRQTSFLEYEAFQGMAEAKMEEIAEEIRRRWGLDRVAMTHRVGRLGIGEPSVVIAVGTPHRKQAFEACEFAIDRLKAEVPIWKKEIGPDGEEWVE